jgi:peptide/nickel transport system permease protein
VSSAASSPGLRRLSLRGPLGVLVTGLRRDRLAAVGAVIVVLIVLLAVFAQWIAPHPADAGTATDPVNSLLAPSWSHPFGTDQVGRDVLSRVIFGARTSLRIAIESLAIAALIGIPLGVAAGYVGGWIDDVIMRITDVFLAFPALLLALALEAVIKPSVGNASIAIAVTWWPWYTRLIRAQASAVASTGYVAAARALGVSGWRIVLRHVLPNSVAPVTVQLSLDFGGVILTAAALSFLGLGAQDSTP